ncbi:MAG: ATP-binding protein [Sphingorhabdus sp.]
MEETLRRIAEALERLAPPPREAADLIVHPAYHWDGQSLATVSQFAQLPASLIVGIDRQKQAVEENSRRHAQGYAAHDVLLWGARGMGKSALVKSVAAALQDTGLPLALVETTADQLASLPALFALLAKADRRFILFIDDMAFEGDDAAPRRLRSMLEGGSEARPANVRLYVTSNRRNIVDRAREDEEAAINTRDVADDRLALADRFGMKLGFQYPDQATFLEMVAAYAEHFNLVWDEADALAFVHQRGQRSGRTAWYYTVELAGRAGKAL